MYRITSTAGLDVSFTDPIQVYDILYAHLAETTRRRTVEWVIHTPWRELPGRSTRAQLPEDPAGLSDFAHDVATGLLWLHHRHTTPATDRPT